MPKKRFTSQYSKPQSTVHPSLGSASAASTSGNRNDAAPSVNELISSLRKTRITTPNDQRQASSAVVAPTMPPSIRSLLSIPETPGPRPRARDRRRFFANGMRVPAGPPPPQSWLETAGQVPADQQTCKQARSYPTDVCHLPGITLPAVGSLQDMCLKQMARNWVFMREYERNNLSEIPTRLRSSLLSYIAVCGPEDGIGFEALQNLLRPPAYEEDEQIQNPTSTVDINDNFNRFDLSSAVGRSVSFKQLTELVTKRQEDSNESWEETVPMSMNPTISHITHLSLSHPPPNISWPKFLTFAQHVPTITHLSLACWPVPNLTPNSTTTVMAAKYGKNVQYGATNLYSHSLDDDYSEASGILRRLATSLYSLEWLDLTGCTTWLQALQYLGDDEVLGLDWRSQWKSLETIIARSGWEYDDEECSVQELRAFEEAYVEAMCTKNTIQDLRKLGGRKGWIDVETDDISKILGSAKHKDIHGIGERITRASDRVRMFSQRQNWGLAANAGWEA